ncbi:hypothetical protein MC885_002681, partial [Smutsia gigantea]
MAWIETVWAPNTTVSTMSGSSSSSASLCRSPPPAGGRDLGSFGRRARGTRPEAGAGEATGADAPLVERGRDRELRARKRGHNSSLCSAEAAAQEEAVSTQVEWEVSRMVVVMAGYVCNVPVLPCVYRMTD